ncbi:MAG: hypothetical protein P8Y77_08620 [Nitrospirota bacterium]
MEKKRVRCPRCKTVHPLSARCSSCGLDFREYARRLREKRAAAEREAAAAGEAQTKPGAGEEKAGEERADGEKKPPEIRIPVVPREPELESIGDLLGATWLLYKGRFWVLVGLYVLSAALVVALPAAIAALGAIIAATVPFAGGAVFGASLLATLAGMLGSIWAFGAFLAASCDETMKFGEALGTGWRRLWSLLWLYLMAGYVVGGGLMLFVLPGLAMLVWFFASQFIIFEEGERGMDAVLKSRAYVRGFGWDVFLRLLVITVLALLASLVPVVGSLLFTPFMVLFMVHIYKDLRGVKGRDVRYQSGAWAKGKWIALATAGYVLPLLAAFFIFGTAVLGFLRGVEGLPAFRELGVISAPAPEARVATSKEVYAQGEAIVVEYSGLPGNERGLITVVEASAPRSVLGETFHTGGKTEGRHTFGGLPPGRYEARVFFDWPSGVGEVRARHAFDVAGPPPGAGVEPELVLERISFAPGEEVVVRFRAPSALGPGAWVGIVPASVGHGSGAQNERQAVARQSLGGRTSGRLVFTAPREAGIYDLRMTSGGGSEAASATFAVESGPGGGAPHP